MVLAVIVSTVAGALVWRGTRPAVSDAPNSSTAPTAGTVLADVMRSGGTAPAVVVVRAGRVHVGDSPEGSRLHNWLAGFTGTIPRPLAVARTETTVANFRRFVQATGTHVPPGCWYHTVEQVWKFAGSASWSAPGFDQTDAHPVVCVGSEEAAAYAAWLTSETGYRYRLPTEIEFEYFNRGGSAGSYSFALSDITELCSKTNGADRSAQFAYAYACTDGYEFTAPVGSFPPNGFGLYDTTGNVWEVTSDCWHSDYVRAAAHLLGEDSSDRTIGGCSGRHVVRGGSFISSPTNLLIAKRDIENFRSTRNGFRVVRELSGGAAN